LSLRHDTLNAHAAATAVFAAPPTPKAVAIPRRGMVR
jgi:hypothetical protein